MVSVLKIKSLNDERTKDSYIKFLMESLDFVGIDRDMKQLIKSEYKRYTIDELRHEAYSRPSTYSRVSLESINRFEVIKDSLKGITAGNEELVLDLDLTIPVMRRIIMRHLKECLKLKFFYNDGILIIHNIQLSSVNLDKLKRSLVYSN